MPAKTSHGSTGAHGRLVTYAQDVGVTLQGTHGAIVAADAILGLTEPTPVRFSLTGERRAVLKGELYALGTYVYQATWDGDEFDIVEVARVVP